MQEIKRIMRYSVEFYLTLGVPLLYLFILYIIKESTHTMYFTFPYLIVGLPLTCAGLILWLLSYVHLGKSFGVLPKQQKRVRSGVYKHIPHPMYGGIGMAFIGFSLLFQSRYGLIMTCVVLIPLLVIRAVLEDRALNN